MTNQEQYIVQMNNGETSVGLDTMDEVIHYLTKNATPEFWSGKGMHGKRRRIEIFRVKMSVPTTELIRPPKILLGLDKLDQQVGEITYLDKINRHHPDFNKYFTRRQAKKALAEQGAVTFISLDASTREPQED